MRPAVYFQSLLLLLVAPLVCLHAEAATVAQVLDAAVRGESSLNSAAGVCNNLSRLCINDIIMYADLLPSFSSEAASPKYIVALQDAPEPEGQQGHGLPMRDKDGQSYSCRVPDVTETDHEALAESAQPVRACQASWHSRLIKSGLEAMHCRVMQCVQDSNEGLYQQPEG